MTTTITNATSAQIVETTAITFVDNATVQVPTSIYNTYEKMRQSVILRPSKMFMKYVLPVILNMQCVGKNWDEEAEIDEFLEEINYYGVKLSPSQIYNVCDACGMIDKLQQIKKYINKRYDVANKRFDSSSLRTRVDNFGSCWDTICKVKCTYANLLTDNCVPSAVTHATILGMLITLTVMDIQTLCSNNITYLNLIDKYLKYFINIVIKKDNSSIVDLNLEASFSATLPDVSTLLTTLKSLF